MPRCRRRYPPASRRPHARSTSGTRSWRAPSTDQPAQPGVLGGAGDRPRPVHRVVPVHNDRVDAVDGEVGHRTGVGRHDRHRPGTHGLDEHEAEELAARREQQRVRVGERRLHVVWLQRSDEPHLWIVSRLGSQRVEQGASADHGQADVAVAVQAQRVERDPHALACVREVPDHHEPEDAVTATRPRGHDRRNGRGIATEHQRQVWPKPAQVCGARGAVGEAEVGAAQDVPVPGPARRRALRREQRRLATPDAEHDIRPDMTRHTPAHERRHPCGEHDRRSVRAHAPCEVEREVRRTPPPDRNPEPAGVAVWERRPISRQPWSIAIPRARELDAEARPTILEPPRDAVEERQPVVRGVIRDDQHPVTVEQVVLGRLHLVRPTPCHLLDQLAESRVTLDVEDVRAGDESRPVERRRARSARRLRRRPQAHRGRASPGLRAARGRPPPASVRAHAASARGGQAAPRPVTATQPARPGLRPSGAHESEAPAVVATEPSRSTGAPLRPSDASTISIVSHDVDARAGPTIAARPARRSRDRSPASAGAAARPARLLGETMSPVR